VNNLNDNYNIDAGGSGSHYSKNKSATTATAATSTVASTTDEIVMEMVEAIIDNNNSVNSDISNNPFESSTGVGGDSDVNLWHVRSELPSRLSTSPSSVGAEQTEGKL
jgi:hypothetical protein